MEKLTFDPSKATRYRKVTRIRAYQSADPITFHKKWGDQKMPAGSWVAIPVDGQTPTSDIYGIEEDAFEATYEEVEPNTYRKTAVVEAYQPGHPFGFVTETSKGAEVENGQAAESDWFIRNPSGECYRISDEDFRNTYVEV